MEQSRLAERGDACSLSTFQSRLVASALAIHSLVARIHAARQPLWFAPVAWIVRIRSYQSIALAALAACLISGAGHAQQSQPIITPSPTCEGTPPCVEKDAETLRYERILSALKQMEGGEYTYSAQKTPASEPASYGPSQLLLSNILDGLIGLKDAQFTFTSSATNQSVTLTKKDMESARARGIAIYDADQSSFVRYIAVNYSDYKVKEIPARNDAINKALKKSGLPKEDWDKWFARAVSYARLENLMSGLQVEFNRPKTIISDDNGKPLPKKDAKGRVNMATFERFIRGKENVPGIDPPINYWDKFKELLNQAFADQPETSRLAAFEPYVRTQTWAEGYWSFYNRSVYGGSTISYADLKEGIAKWYQKFPEIDKKFIEKRIEAAAKNQGKDVKQLHSEDEEEAIAKEAAATHNGQKITGTYAAKFIKIWKDIEWKFRCPIDHQIQSSTTRTLPRYQEK